MKITEEDIDNKVNEIRGFLKKHGVYKCCSCNFYNWDVKEHCILLLLSDSPPEDMIFHYSVSYGVYDWIILPRSVEDSVHLYPLDMGQ